MRQSRLLALLILLFGVGYLWVATQITQPHTVSAVGPRIFPLAIGIGIILSAFWLFGWPGSQDDLIGGVSVPEQTEAVTFDWRRVFGLLLLLIGYIVVYRPLGYILSTVLFTFGGSQLLGERTTIRRDLLIALLLTVVISFVFARLLGINLPEGLVGW